MPLGPTSLSQKRTHSKLKNMAPLGPEECPKDNQGQTVPSSNPSATKGSSSRECVFL